MDYDDDVVFEDVRMLSDKSILDDIEVVYRVWANGRPLSPNHCIRVVLDRNGKERFEEEVSPELMARIWAGIPSQVVQAATRKARRAA